MPSLIEPPYLAQYWSPKHFSSRLILLQFPQFIYSSSVVSFHSFLHNSKETSRQRKFCYELKRCYDLLLVLFKRFITTHNGPSLWQIFISYQVKIQTLFSSIQWFSLRNISFFFPFDPILDLYFIISCSLGSWICFRWRDSRFWSYNVPLQDVQISLYGKTNLNSTEG